MKDLGFKIQYLRNNWKLIIHLLFRTYYFGVNNHWRSDFPSMFGWPIRKRIWAILTVWPIIDNYRQMRFRAQIGFVSEKTFEKIFTSKHQA